MALLRNREVTILRTADEIDGSTFQIRYHDGETELAKMNELIFSQAEYDQFVRSTIPSVQVMDQSQIKERADRTRPEEDKDAKVEQKKIEDNRPEAVKPQLKFAPTVNEGSPTDVSTRGTNSQTSKPNTLPGNRNETRKA